MASVLCTGGLCGWVLRSCSSLSPDSLGGSSVAELVGYLAVIVLPPAGVFIGLVVGLIIRDRRIERAYYGDKK